MVALDGDMAVRGRAWDMQQQGEGVSESMAGRRAGGRRGVQQAQQAQQVNQVQRAARLCLWSQAQTSPGGKLRRSDVVAALTRARVTQSDPDAAPNTKLLLPALSLPHTTDTQ